MLWPNLRRSFRSLLRTPLFTLTAVVSLAIGIGANAAIFSFVNAILLKRLAVPAPEQLVTFARTYHGESSGMVCRMRTIDELVKRASPFNGIFGEFARPVSLTTGDKAEWVRGELVTGQYFATLQVKPAAGRLLNDEDIRNATANPVCVLSYGMWQREFAGDAGVVGRSVFLNGRAYRVLGVSERAFGGTELGRPFDLQIPATRIGDFMPGFGDQTGVDWLKTLSWLNPMARLKPGVTRPEAQIRTQQMLRQIEMEANGGKVAEKPTDLRLEDGSQGLSTLRSAFGRPVLVLMAAVGLVLCLACANLANLLLARAQTRAKEMAVRLSLGASRATLMRQLFTESLLLAVSGGLAGLALSFWITKALLAFLNAGKSPVSALQVKPDAAVLIFSLALSFATALLFGLIPAWQATRPNLLPGLQLDVSGSGPSHRVLGRKAFVVIQIALSVVVVFAAGLLTQTLRRLQTVNLGFRPEQLMALNVDPAADGHSGTEVSAILDEILARARALPGVQAASLAATTPHGSMAISMSVAVPGYTPKRTGDDVADFNFISRDFFRTVGQRLLRGRDFSETDAKSSPRVAIVNQLFAAQYFGRIDPIGRKFRQGDGDVEIVGITENARDRGVKSAPEATAYLPEKQGQNTGLTLLVRSGDEPQELARSLVAIVKSIDRRMPVISLHTLDSELAAGLSSERILSYLSTLLAALATLLAGIGLYGAVAYSVARRKREIGIRFAVGGQRSDVARLFAHEGFVVMLLGLGAGAPLAIAGASALRGLLFGIAVTDPLTLAFSVSVLFVAALLATAIPLWRASHVDPIVALRNE